MRARGEVGERRRGEWLGELVLQIGERGLLGGGGGLEVEQLAADVVGVIALRDEGDQGADACFELGEAVGALLGLGVDGACAIAEVGLDVRVTMRYSHLAPDAFAEDYGRLPVLGGGGVVVPLRVVG